MGLFVGKRKSCIIPVQAVRQNLYKHPCPRRFWHTFANPISKASTEYPSLFDSFCLTAIFQRCSLKGYARIDMAFGKIGFGFEPCRYFKRQNCVCRQDFFSDRFFHVINAQNQKIVIFAMIFIGGFCISAFSALLLHILSI